jgi:predicted transcriptional regulator
LKSDDSTNSTLLISPRGHGRTTLLYHILQRSNPKWFPRLPDKQFESEILKESDEIFKRKVWIQDDLITTFRGTSTKQREQLMGFLNTLLTKGEYGRGGRTVKGKIVCVYGIASEAYRKRHAKDMFQSTFLDRFMQVRYDFDERMEREILEAKRRNRGKQLPKVVLPLKNKLVDALIPSHFHNEIDMFALELNRKDIMTASRAQTYIENFLKSNAVLNKRVKVCEDDLRLLKLVWSLHFGVNLGSVDMRIRTMILERSMVGQVVSGREIKDKVKKKGFSESAVQKSLSNLRINDIIQFKKTPLNPGYDYIYGI